MSKDLKNVSLFTDKDGNKEDAFKIKGQG